MRRLHWIGIASKGLRVVAVAVLAAAAIMVSPLVPWTAAVVGCGAATAVGGFAVLILWLLRHGP